MAAFGMVGKLATAPQDRPALIAILTQAAHDESLTLPAVRDLIAQAGPLLTDRPDGASLIPISGKGLD